MSGHTPGPWFARCGYVETSDHELHRVADVARQADADLIAAAPELLEALRGIIGLERRKLLRDKAALAWVGAAEAAIAKAEGRT